MGRYRSPRPPGSAYITPEGEKKLQDELRYLWKVERPQVTATVSAAAGNGDRSENGDYIYGKRRLGEIDRRVRYLSKRLEQLTVVNELPRDKSKVYFGAWVTIEDDEEYQLRYRIVGPDEFDINNKLISMDSPMAKAMLGKKNDDEFSIVSAGKTTRYVIVDIQYNKKNASASAF